MYRNTGNFAHDKEHKVSPPKKFSWLRRPWRSFLYSTLCFCNQRYLYNDLLKRIFCQGSPHPLSGYSEQCILLLRLFEWKKNDLPTLSRDILMWYRILWAYMMMINPVFSADYPKSSTAHTPEKEVLFVRCKRYSNRFIFNHYPP